MTLPPYYIPVTLDDYVPAFHASIVQLLTKEKVNSFEVTAYEKFWEKGCVIGTSECPYDRQIVVKIVSNRINSHSVELNSSCELVRIYRNSLRSAKLHELL